MRSRFLVAFLALVMLLSACAPSSSPAAIQQIPPTLLSPKTITAHSTKNDEALTVPAKVGERVEIEVKPLHEMTKYTIATLTDPYGNVVAESANRILTNEEITYFNQRVFYNGVYIYKGQKRSLQEYPWRFAFFATFDGDYVISVGDRWNDVKRSRSVSLNATVFPK